MSGQASARVAVVLVRTVDRFVDAFDFAALDEARRSAALREIGQIRAGLGHRSDTIDSAFAKLEQALRRRGKSPLQANPQAARKLSRLLRALTPLAMASTALTAFVATPAMAIVPATVGGSIVNPSTGATETVAQLLGTYAVVTSEGNFILRAQTVGDTFSVVDNTDPDNVITTNYEVTAVTTGANGVTQVTVKNLSVSGNPTSAIATTAVYGSAPPIGGGTGGDNDYSGPITSGAPFIIIRAGGDGGDGRNGGGVCFGDLGCIQYAPGNGGDGATHSGFSETVPVTHGEIATENDGEAGIVVVSKGGAGGDGGYGVGNIPPAKGGAGGDGGTVTATNETTVVTEGSNAYGMLVQSVGGRSGSGGNCYIACSGGGPGVPGDGGSATGINAGSITTGGNDAVGLLVQSSGGNSGTGGSSYGIVGDAGGGGYGGNGGDAHAVNNNFIKTTGDRAFGVLAQSIGGIGGNSGNAAGIVAFSADAGGGGSGGNASVTLGSNSITTTEGDWAHAVFAQSIGGGGGSSGWAGGIASFGSAGGSGGTGGEATVTAEAGAFIETKGIGAYGIYAESVGGSGGTAGGTGGVFTMGGSGGTGQTGGKVTVESSATIVTHEQDSRGIFAQSVGGGGGSANASGGLVSLGGSGGTGADGGEVSVTLGEASSIKTEGAGADGVFAQSVGGGGGSGAASGGLVALGGSGSVGGSGKAVTIDNGGTIETEENFARGIFAQSIGGGGGSGGDSGGLAAIGGSGSGGGTGGTVIVGNSGLITTGGNMSSAVQAQSIGGGGGDGGSTGGVLLTIGGKGGAGTSAGTATANISGAMHTTGDDSHGLFVQAVGGGGGNGGSSSSVSAFVGIALGGDGNTGGKGGVATVNFTPKSVDIDSITTLVDPWIKTEGDRSRGVYVQSVGGGGGSGGFAANLTLGAWGAVSVALGGKGDSGGDGDLVKVTGDVDIETTGDYSEGMLLQSIGGGGGAGGFAVAGTISAGLGFSGSVSVGLGGAGGDGGAGGTVEMDSGGSITTEGNFSSGLIAQSIGGGGGAGGFSIAAALSGSDTAAVSVAVGIGGSGGDGGIGGTVDVDFDGDITTGADGDGDDSHGALIQSVGGGGGAGGFNVSGAIAGSGVASIGIAVGLGGSGGGGGNGGTVTGSIGGNISTDGDRSSGAIIQSIGGGGGSGGFNISGTLTGSGTVAGGISVGLGGSGAGAGDGGTVTGSVGGTILTTGNQSDGLVVQSVGGGGGSGGFNVSGNIAASGTAAGGIGVGLGGSGGDGGNGGLVTAHALDTIETQGNQSRGFIAQSIGGGGGSGGFNITGNIAASGTGAGTVGVGLGGTGGDGGFALGVIATAKAITTAGDDSAGFIAQSVGGGGGVGGFNVTAGMAFAGTGSGAIGVGLGGAGGDGGNAGTVDATVVGNVVTEGDRAGGVLAQSVGGGGGSGGFNITGGIAFAGTGSGAISVGLGGSGGSAGNALGVTLNVTGAVQTGEGTEDGDRGADSDGIVAQSLGGGGGNGAFNVTGNIAAAGTGSGQIGVGIGGHGGGGGSAGAVTLNVNNGATVSDLDRIAAITQQDHSAGIIAQSVGGGGGNGGFNVTGGMAFGGTGAGGINVGIGGTGGTGNSAGIVTADISGFVRTYGDDSLGVLAQSVGGGGGNGGFNVTAGLNFGAEGSGGINVGIGGSGGKGGSGEAVTLRINDQISAPEIALAAATTSGDRSAGVIAQSLGGGGGNGGFNVTAGINISGGFTGGANIGIGGMGGDGGAAKKVIGDITGTIATGGDQSGGLLLQSVGGGGGNGGFNVTGGLALSKGGAGQLGVGIGGFGGDGGAGGDVELDWNQRTDDSGNTLIAASTLGDDSDAVIVQSLGGGGGNGGFNVTGGATLSMGGAGTVGVGIGGFGGDGGISGVVKSRIAGDVGTAGINSNAVLVQSAGGGGGNGGFNVTGGLTLSKAASGNVGVGIGGFGGKGGAGNDVTSTLVGDVTTLDHSSSGVTVQSLGGGGGNGGFNVTGLLSLSVGAGATGNIGVGVGGFGGDGGAGLAATSTITGNIYTRGSESYGLLVQSQGGGGGNGGFNVTGNVGVSTQGSAGNLGIGIGGFGGGGGSAGTVISTMTGNIVTGAADQDGALLVSNKSSGATVQAVGGGGGNGGFNVTGNLTATMGSGVSGDIGIGIGGFAGDGGDGGEVTATHTGHIVTRGDESYGMLVQSAGGGGGNGGFNVTGNVAITKGSSGNVGVGIGGFGGGGGGGKAVIANLTGDISTDGDKAYGATVQSLGGAGGAGGMNITGGMTISAGTGTSIVASVGIGGFGGDGGNGGTVNGSATGLYVTTRADSHGLLVQSAGGGGGAGGMNIAGSLALSSGTTGSGAIGIGGFGGGGGNGMEVIFERTGDTFTSGANSNGVTIQSVGGGGGKGGINISGSVAATKGSAGSVGFGLGGFGGDGGNGGDVTGKVYGNVIATGLASDETVTVFDLSDLPDDVEVPADELEGLLAMATQRTRSGGSTGILIQSVGGGGGNGGMNVTGSLAITAGGASPTGRVASIGIGGFGGAGGNAGKVVAIVGPEEGSSDRIQVQGIGDSQMAFAAQSIGGGGGAGGMNISGGIATAGQITVGIGGFGGAGGFAGDVDATVDADLFVAGNNSIGFLAQSIGGGGGAGGINISGGIQAATKGNEPTVVFGLGGFGGTGNTSGNVTGVQHGQVMVEGQFAYGVLAQSVGGGGGAGGMNITAAVTGAGNPARKSEGILLTGGVGGNGGTGANAGWVDLTSDGNVFVNTVITEVDGELTFSGVEGAMFAPGVVAQSIGGGGGAGGMNVTGALAPKGQPIAVGVGGTGGVGGDAGDVTLTRGYGEDGPGVIITYGQGSHGLVAQSIGGGGGNAGFNMVLAANKSKPKNPQYGATVTVGGDGGSSGDGKDVEVAHKGDIYTNGSGSNGILAQSISGGGGSGATNITGALMKDSSVVSLAIGGRGGDGGNAGSVTVTHDGTIATVGNNSAAIRAQSIGSGGGDVSAEEDLTVFFDEDWPIDVAIPIGPKNEIAVGIGDVGGKGGVAGDVTVNAAGTLVTQGIDAVGIHAQSIGGSGGASGTTSVGVSGENQKGSQGGGVSVAVGLEGGEGGIAGDVTVDSSAIIATAGERSRGIFAQSIGGSGGSGGEAKNNIENASNEMHISVGGPGGSGSQAGAVTITQSGRIDTFGDDADGILAQSIGGGGGSGGASGTQNLQYEGADSNTVAVAVGGSGGNGAIAGDVSVTNTGIIMTSGDKSFGIRAQSIGGGGGVGGAIDSKKMLITGTSNSLEFNVGGSGGEGSQAGDVDVVNEGLIWTTGIDAAAISANSIGGGGGDAGSILDLSVSAAVSNTFKANIGGTGGSGGIAGDVSVINRSTGGENSGYLITEGDGAYGIFAQSLGGSGGNSSTILSISVDGGAGSISAGFNFGNAGGTGNLAGDVLVDNGGVIDTSGAGAHGILAQSIGGGGGNGGMVLTGSLNLTMPFAAPLVSIGGSGGDGSDAGDVVVINSGSIVTRGDGAHGIVAQSIGGGGGNAGVGLALTGEPGSLIIGNTLAASLGATTMTGTGGEGGTVTVTHTGDITVFGEGSQAIVAESINGGGGTLKLDFDQVAAIFADDDAGPAEAPDPLVVARSGSIGSTGMAGGKVTVNSTGTIGVGGEGGVAINLQSIGGGGGTIVLNASLVAPISPLSAGARTTFAADITPVGFDIALGGVDGSGNSGGAIGGAQEGEIVTASDFSLGLVIQSIGGGGGRAIASLSAEDMSLIAATTVAIGGTNQVDSAGGAITHVQDGTLTSLGDFSIGGLIQSVGGGGGVAQVGYSQTVAPDALTTLALTPFEVLPLMSPITLGASGGSGNDGGAVSQTLTGGAIAIGDYSAALLLQSIGAGGGAVILSGDANPQITLGGSAGAEGSGGAVSLTNNGAIGSTGTGNYGVVLQSIGGGGGAVFGDFTEANVTLSPDNVGDGGVVSFTQVGDVGVLGDRSVGILAQSLGGGGGFVYGQFAGTAGGEGAGGAITLDVDGAIIAYGLDSTAVLAQSLGSLGGGNIELLSSGDIRGGSGTGIAVNFDGGADNLIDTSGTLSAVSGLAIKTTTGNDTVENHGAIVGNVYLGEGTNLLHNNLGATFVTIDTLDLQDGAGTGAFVNEGALELGLRAPRYPIDLAGGETFDVPAYDDIRTATFYGTTVISHVALDGEFRQLASGESWWDIAFGPYDSDRIDVTGDAIVDGTANITLTWLENNDPVTLIATGGSGTDLGLEVPGTIALDWEVLDGPEGIRLTFDSDFGQPFLNPNQQALGHHLDSALDVGGAAGLGRLLALLGNLTDGQEDIYQAIFDELDPESILAPAIESLDSARAFSKGVMGCDPIRDAARDGCVWGRIDVHTLSRDGDDAAPIDLDEGARLRFGGAFGLGSGFSLGGAFGYDTLGDLRFDNTRAVGDDGETVHVGLGLGKVFGPDGRGSAGLNIAAGWQKMTMVRMQDVFEPLTGTSRVRSDHLAADLNLGYSFGSGPWFVRPNVDAYAIRLTLDGLEEQGLGGLGMRVDQSREWYLAVEPKLTVGAEFGDFHLAVTGGGMFSNKDSIAAPMRFLGAGAASDPALIHTLIDDQALVGGIQFGIDAGDRVDVSVGYEAYLGSQIESHTANVKLRIAF
jgi:hypothetical protein